MEKKSTGSRIKEKVLGLIIFFVIVLSILLTNIPAVFAEDGSQPTDTQQITDTPLPTDTPQPTEEPQPSETAQPSGGAAYTINENSVSTLSDNNAFNDLGYVPMDTAMDPDRDVLYMTETGGYRLYRIDLSTGGIEYLEFQYKAERLTVKNGKIYVTLPKQAHSSQGNGSGYIGVVDAATFTLDKTFDVVPDPYDIEADSTGRVYIASGSGQWSIITIYNAVTGEKVDTFNPFYYQGLLDFNTVYNKLYSISANLYPRDIIAYEISDEGKVTAHYNSPYHGDYAMDTYMKISPDGKFILNGSGNIFKCADTKENGDMTYVRNIGHTFSSVCFDAGSDEFYIASKDRMYIYDYDTWTVKGVQGNGDSYIGVYCNGSHFASLMEASGGKYYIIHDDKSPVVDVSGVSICPNGITIRQGKTAVLTAVVHPQDANNKNVSWSSTDESVATVSNGVITAAGQGSAVIKVTTEDGGFVGKCNVTVVPYATYNAYNDLGFTPMDTAMDPDRDVIYMTETGGYKLYSIDLSTGEKSEIYFPYKAERLTVKNGKIYVTLPHGNHNANDFSNGSGSVAVVDAATFSVDKIFDVVPDPYDIEADDTGRVYIGSGSGQWSILTVYDASTGQQVNSIGSYYYKSLLDYNQAYNKLYSVPTQSSPIDITAYEITDGKITTRYNWPTRSNYSMTSYMKISPDGKYLFDGSGNIFACAQNRTGDMVYAGNIDLNFDSICFDLSKNEFYIENDHGMYICDYNTFKVKTAQGSNDFYKGVYCNSSHFVSLMDTSGGKYYLVLDNKTPGLRVSGIVLSEKNVTIVKDDTETVTATISPEYATNQNIISWTSSNESVATVSNGVITAVNYGNAVITVKTEDGGYTDTCNVFVIPDNAYNLLGFVPLDVAKDPGRDIVYMTASGGYKLYRIDLTSGKIDRIIFQYKAEKLAVKNDKIYVTLTKAAHGGSGDGSGYVGVVDAATFTLDKIFDVVPDPYDIEADSNDRVYIGSGSGQWSILTVYDSRTGLQVDSLDGYRAMSLLDYNQVYDKLYSITTDESPRDITAYDISAGKITANYDSPYHGDFPMSTYMKISPDGQLIFNGSGYVFLCYPTRDYDMYCVGYIGSEFNSICFDLPSDQFYIANGKTVMVYSYSNGTPLKTLKCKYDVTSVIRGVDKLITVQQIATGKFNLAVMLSRPASVSAKSASYKSVSVSWSKVDGASGYLVYRATSEYGKYSLIKTTKGLSYTNTGLSTGKTYYYKVKAYTGNVSAAGDFSETASAAPALDYMSGVKAAVYSPTSIKISWNAIPGCSKYEVWRCDTENGSYAKIATTSSKYYIDKGLTTNKTYYYKVCAYRTVNGVKIYNQLSDVVSAAPALTVVTSPKASRYNSTKIKLTWGSVSGATGYEIQRCISGLDADFMTIKTTTGTGRTYYDEGLTTGVKYYYRIRAYRTSGGNNYYGGWSAVVFAIP